MRRVLHECVTDDEGAEDLVGRIAAGELAPFDEVKLTVLHEPAHAPIAVVLGQKELTPGLYWAHGVTLRVLCDRAPEEIEPPFEWYGGREPKKLDLDTARRVELL